MNNIKIIKDKAGYLAKNYPFENVPKMTDKKHCVHCANDFIVADYKVQITNGEEYIVCPNAPSCDGTVIDWFDI